MVENIRLQDWTKERIDDVREVESHTSYDSTVKALLRDRQTLMQILSEEPNAQAIGPSTQQLAADGGAGDLPIPESGETLAILAGMTGSGKTTTAAYQAHRVLENRDDVNIVALDYLDQFDQFAETHDSETLVVGPGSDECAINPLEIHSAEPTGQHNQTDHFERKLRDVDTFVRALMSGETTDFSSPLKRATLEAYKRAGITHDPTTHDHPSPTIADVQDVLSTMVEEPDSYSISDTPAEAETIVAGASEALRAMQQFNTGGQSEWLAGESGVELSDVPFTRVILPPTPDRQERSLTLSALLTTLTQQAMQIPGETIFILDEAHTLLASDSQQEMLQRKARAGRHTQTGFWLTIQLLERLTSTGDGQNLLDSTDRLYLHTLDSLAADVRRVLSLSDEQSRYVRNADTAIDDNSPQLLHRDPTGSWYPYTVDIPSSTLDDLRTNP